MASFIDKVVGGLNKGVTTVSEGSKLLVEKARLNTSIQDIEKERNGLIQNLGTLVYNLLSSDSIKIAQCEEIFNEIASCDSKISALQEQLRELESAKEDASSSLPQVDITDGIQCSCGFVNKKESLFCASCGQPVKAKEPETQTPPVEGMQEGMQCSCGFVNKPNARFCVKCGMSLIND